MSNNHAVKIAPRPKVTKTTPMSTTPPAPSTRAPPTTTLPPLLKAAPAATSKPNSSSVTAKTWTKKAYATPQTTALPKPLSTSTPALAQTLAPLLSRDVASHRYDTLPFALQLLAHLEKHNASRGGAQKNDLVVAFRSFAPSALSSWNDGGSSCVGHCLSLVDRLRAQGLPAALVPVGHPDEQHGDHEPPYAHVAVVVPFVGTGVDAGKHGVVVCDTGNNVAAPAVLFPGVPVTVALGDGARSFTYALAQDGKSVVITRPLPHGTETTTMSLVELLNPDACLTAPYAAMNPLITLCARDDKGGVTASIVVDVESGVLRFSMGKHKTKIAFGDDFGAAVDDSFAKALGTTAAVLTARLQTIVDGAATLNALRTQLEAGAA